MDIQACPHCKAPDGGDPSHRCSSAVSSRESDVPTIRKTGVPERSGKSQSPASVQPRPAGKPEGSAALRKGQEAPPPDLVQLLQDPAKVVNQYVLAGMLGQGGMGQVWKAWDTKLARWTALKFLTLTDPASQKRFEREAKLAARLRHPNICAIYEVGEDKGRHFIAMEFVDGVALGKANLSLREAPAVIAKIARALEEAHKEGVVHRDLKPDNLMITKGGRPYVMDFGLAKTVEAESSLSVSGDIMGTPAFMSPEQARGEVDTIDGRTDVYSLGATLYALLTGEKPFQGRTSMEIVIRVLNQDATPPSRLKPGVSPALDAVVLKAMEKDRERRYQSSSEFADDLDRFLANQDVLARPPSFPRRVLVRLKRNSWPAFLGAVLLVAGITGFLTLARSKETGPSPGAEWVATFLAERRALEYREWKAGDPAVSTRVHTLLGRLDGLPPELSREAADWLRKEIELAENALELWTSRPRSEWSKLRDPASRGLGWCDAANAAIKGYEGEFAVLAGRLGELRRGSERIARWRGEFTLRIAVVPFGELTSLKRAGHDIPLKDRETPLVVPELEIGDYEMDLTADSLPPLHFVIPGGRLREGVTSTLVGDLRKAGSVQIVP
jgi:serine/threonine protein kinase